MTKSRIRKSDTIPLRCTRFHQRTGASWDAVGVLHSASIYSSNSILPRSFHAGALALSLTGNSIFSMSLYRSVLLVLSCILICAKNSKKATILTLTGLVGGSLSTSRTMGPWQYGHALLKPGVNIQRARHLRHHVVSICLFPTSSVAVQERKD